MVAGAALTAGSLLFASQADSYLPFLISYIYAGFGVAMATLLPAALVVAHGFQAKRGMAMGVAVAGVSVGGMIMNLRRSPRGGYSGRRLARCIYGLGAAGIAGSNSAGASGRQDSSS